jgi:hypothetical protein
MSGLPPSQEHASGMVVTECWLNNFSLQDIPCNVDIPWTRGIPRRKDLEVQLPTSVHAIVWRWTWWSWALLEKLPIMQLLKKFPSFYGTQRFITVFTRALHWPLSWTRSIQFTPLHLISLRSILILSTHVLVFLVVFLYGFPTNILYAFLFSLFVLNALPISSSSTWSF